LNFSTGGNNHPAQKEVGLSLLDISKPRPTPLFYLSTLSFLYLSSLSILSSLSQEIGRGDPGQPTVAVAERVGC